MEHASTGLDAAGQALDALDAQPELVDDVDEAAHQAVIHQFEEEARKRQAARSDDDELYDWQEAIDLERELHAKGDLPSRKMARLEHLRKQHWYSGLIPTLEAFGLMEEAQ
ncbi:hypothetical protein D3C78_1415250 [compost metagenome]